MSIGVNKNVVKSVITPIGSGAVATPELNSEFEHHYMSIAFFSDDGGRVVVPKSTMTGSVTFAATVNGTEYGVVQVGDNPDGVLTLGGANELLGQLSGSYSKCACFLDIITDGGATHCQVSVSSFKG